MSAAAKVAKALARYGRPMTLRRRIGTGGTFSDVIVFAVTGGYKAGDLLGLQEGDIKVTLSQAEITAAAWSGPPRKGDLVLIDGRTFIVLGAETRFLGAGVLSHDLWCRGG